MWDTSTNSTTTHAAATVKLNGATKRFIGRTFRENGGGERRTRPVAAGTLPRCRGAHDATGIGTDAGR